MKIIFRIFLILLIFTVPGIAQDTQSAGDLIARMKTALDLQDDQITNITPIIEKYTQALNDLQKSVDDGAINPSAIGSQRQGLEDEETQELSAYFKPYQLSEWRSMQKQMGRFSDRGDSNVDDYSNLPKNNPAS